ncbi:hypothetical protein [Segniliparus rugosus]|uniref:Uncharacterized protein n=1 Tax=Segniliparus rugosus (strain ATCC BAA-974 / DSM 45345 / CCUG 50838 / CIP 108380 / JCM 13579 / CDC 945) TaxID=679197 RepID=E5XVB2_SEGRC|nr:hypothetical protein [Segniliparus rugosus]EFV11725.2 hypothetical protein HMPREF9336_03434 [Segniliparus rugosus ATCC BAA-974]
MRFAALAMGLAGLSGLGASPASADGEVRAYCIWDIDHFGPDGQVQSFETFTSDGEGATEEEAIADAKAHAGAPAWDCHIAKGSAREAARPDAGRADADDADADQEDDVA